MNDEITAKDEPPSRVLLLMRHGKAESSAPSDAQRPLNDKGREQSAVVGQYLRSQELVPHVVLVSSAQRTRDTCETLSAELGQDVPIEFRDDFYHAGSREILDALAHVPSERRIVLVIGHEPTMSHLASYLASPDRSDSAALAQVRIGVPTGSMSVLSSTRDSWAELGEQELILHTLVRG